jgi:hypothetical protein
VPWGTLCGYALAGHAMDNLLNLERAHSAMSRQMLDECGSVSALGCSGSLIEMRFLSSCTNVSRM